MNRDASFQEGRAGIAVIFRRDNNTIREAIFLSITALCALEGELKTILIGCRYAMDHEWLEIYITSDAAIATVAIRIHKPPPN